jgi:hypothetical protein
MVFLDYQVFTGEQYSRTALREIARLAAGRTGRVRAAADGLRGGAALLVASVVGLRAQRT